MAEVSYPPRDGAREGNRRPRAGLGLAHGWGAKSTPPTSRELRNEASENRQNKVASAGSCGSSVARISMNM